MFAVRTKYKLRPGQIVGCGEKGLTLTECDDAIYLLGYKHPIIRTIRPDMPKGCVVAEDFTTGVYTKSYYNGFEGQSEGGYSVICYAGILVTLLGFQFVVTLYI